MEEEFSVTQDNVIIRGRLDRVDEKQGRIHIIDYKTAEVKKQADADKRAKESLQLAIYALAWQAKHQKLPYRTELYFIENGLVGSVAKEIKDIKKTWDKIKKVEQGIRKANFAAKPNTRTCSYCAYNNICPASAV